ncbi:F-box protein PP2-B11-like [Phragmites australis]|uniref:F-box protein PP2-B11-like n=1 Tax=Phragmites australis TaxID=29695 RepID=UPI002D7710FA|nr:F-box protein PP2-B11-like [Phragmites australis]
MDGVGAGIYRLPEECVAYAISLTTPGDACHSSAVVSPAFKAAADAAAVWARFLPPDHAAILAGADEPVDCESKKELFSRLCDRPVLLDGATMSFGLVRRSGKKCFMLSARALSIVWGADPACWIWTASLRGSRFPEVAKLVNVCWLDITGKLKLSLLTPRTTYAAYLVFWPAFKAIADSDAVWARFLPPDHAAVLARADDPVDCESKKELFSRLCDRPVLLDGATMSFGLVRRSGAKCFMLSARALSIVWGDDPACWIWTASLPGSRFAEVAELVDVCWLEITGKLQLSLLTPWTTYTAYLVFSIADDSYGLECNVGILPPKATVTVVSGTKPTATTSTEHAICLQHMHGEEETVMHRRKQQYMRLRKDYARKLLTREADPDIRCPRRRGDGWAEVELGEFAVADHAACGEDGVVEVSLKEIDSRRWKRGLIVHGIEIRPKHTS